MLSYNIKILTLIINYIPVNWRQYHGHTMLTHAGSNPQKSQCSTIAERKKKTVNIGHNRKGTRPPLRTVYGAQQAKSQWPPTCLPNFPDSNPIQHLWDTSDKQARSTVAQQHTPRGLMEPGP